MLYITATLQLIKLITTLTFITHLALFIYFKQTADDIMNVSAFFVITWMLPVFLIGEMKVSVVL